AHRLIMFDEPTAALGVHQTKATLSLIRGVADQGVATIVISHNMEDVFAVADRIVALRLGSVALDTPAEDTSREEGMACITMGRRGNPPLPAWRAGRRAHLAWAGGAGAAWRGKARGPGAILRFGSGVQS